MITIEYNGAVLAGGKPLRFFHFTKVTWVGELMLERYAGNSLAVFELIKWYRTRLVKNVVIGLPEKWWAFDSYSDGVPIKQSQRIAYRTRADLRELSPNPFTAESTSLLRLID